MGYLRFDFYFLRAASAVLLWIDAGCHQGGKYQLIILIDRYRLVVQIDFDPAPIGNAFRCRGVNAYLADETAFPPLPRTDHIPVGFIRWLNGIDLHDVLAHENF